MDAACSLEANPPFRPLLLWFTSSRLLLPPPPPLPPPSLAYLCNLVEQFVVFLPFLQGAQIAAHSSCQGNAAERPLECARRLRCVRAPPRAMRARAPCPWLPPALLSLIRVSSEMLLCCSERGVHTCFHCLLGVFTMDAEVSRLPVTPPDSSLACLRALLTPPPPLPVCERTRSCTTLLARGDTPPPVAGCPHMPASTSARE